MNLSFIEGHPNNTVLGFWGIVNKEAKRRNKKTKAI